MSFSSFIADIASRFLGDYIDGFNPENMEISIIQGSATMRNLKLKKSVLDKFDLPVKISSSYIGHIEIKVPWSNLQKESAVIVIKDIFLVASPVANQTFTKTEQEERDHNLKMSKLQLASFLGLDVPNEDEEEAAKKKKEEADKKKTNEPGYFEGLAVKVIDNMQIFLDNVHIRYEDSVSHEDGPFAIGVVIHHIHVQSTDENWKPTFNVVNRILMNKILDVTTSHYFDMEPTLIGNAPEAEFVKTMREICLKEEKNLESTISASVKATIDSNLRPDFTRPKAVIDIVVTQIGGAINPGQFKMLNDLITWVTQWDKKNKYKRHHPPPTGPIPNNSAPWWKFVVEAVTFDVREAMQRWNWDWIKVHDRNRKAYIELYKLVIANQLMNKEQTELFEKIHRSYDYEDILSWRKLANAFGLAEKRRQKKIQAKLEERKQKRSWFENLVTSDADVKTEVAETALKDLYQLIGYDAEASKQLANIEYPPNYVKNVITLTVQNVVFKLCDDKNKPIISAILKNLQVKTNVMPTTTTIDIGIETISIMDHYTKAEATPFFAVDYGHPLSSATKKMIEIGVNVNPPDEGVDLKLSFVTQPVLVSFSKAMVDRVVKFYGASTGNQALMEQFAMVSDLGLEKISQQVESQIKYALQEQPHLAITLDIPGLTVVIPENAAELTCPTLVLNTGRLRLTSDLTKVQDASQNPELFVQEYFFDKYSVSVTGISAYTSSNFSNWRQVLEDDFVLRRVDLNVQLKVRQVPVTTIPNFIIQGGIPKLSICFGTDHLKDILRVVKVLLTPSIEVQEKGVIPKTQSNFGKKPVFAATIHTDGIASRKVPLLNFGASDAGFSGSNSFRGALATSDGSGTGRILLKTLTQRNKSMLLAKKPSEKPMSPEKNNSSSGSFEPYKLEVAVIKLVQLNFEIELFECTIRHFDAKPTKTHSEAVIPLLKLELRSLKSDVEIGNREISFKGLLKSMALINMLDHVDETPKYIFVSQLGEENQNMADISYKWIDPTSKKMFKGVENDVDVIVHKLILTIDRPALAIFLNSAIEALNRIFTDLKAIIGTDNPKEYQPTFRQLDTERSSASNPRYLGLIRSASKVSTRENSSPNKNAAIKQKNYGLSLKLKATEVDLVLLKNEEHFASVQLLNFDVKVNIDKHNVAEIEGQLEKLYLEICSLHDTKWARMVSVEQGVSFKVITYPRAMTDYPGFDVDLQISVSEIDVAYHQVYTLGMVAYFENFFEEFKNHFFSLRRKIEDLTEKDDSIPKEKPPMVKVSAKVTKKLNMMIPINPYSEEGLVVYLSQVVVTSDFLESRDITFGRYNIDATDIKIYAIMKQNDQLELSQLVSHAQVFLSVDVPIEDITLIKAEIPEAIILLKAEHLIITISAAQCLHFLRVTNQNFAQFIPMVDDELVSVKNKLKHTQVLLVQEEDDSVYVAVHITIDIKLLGISLLDQNILVPAVGSVSSSVISFRDFVDEEAVIDPTATRVFPMLDIAIQNLTSNIVLDNKKNVDVEFHIKQLTVSYPRSKDLFQDLITFEPLRDEVAVVLKVKTDHLGLNVAIDFILNTPIVTPTKDAIGELIMFATNHLVIPFGDVREQFKIMFSKSMNQKKIDLVKLGKMATDKELVSYLSLNLQLKTVSVYLLKAFQDAQTSAIALFVGLMKVNFKEDQSVMAHNTDLVMDISTVSFGRSAIDTAKRKLVNGKEGVVLILLPLDLCLKQKQTHIELIDGRDDLDLKIFKGLTLHISSKEVTYVLDYFPIWWPLVEEMKQFYAKTMARLEAMKVEEVVKKEVYIASRLIKLNVPSLEILLSNMTPQESLHPLLFFSLKTILITIDMLREDTKDIKVLLESFALHNRVAMKNEDTQERPILIGRPTTLVSTPTPITKVEQIEGEATSSENEKFISKSIKAKPSKKNFVELKYFWCSPKFAEYKGLCHDIGLQVDNVELVVDRTGLLALAQAASEVVITCVNFIEKSDFGKHLKARKENAEEGGDGETTKVSLKLDELSVVLKKKEFSAFLLSLVSTKLGVEISQDKTILIKGSINNASLVNKNDPLWGKIIDIQNAPDFKLSKRSVLHFNVKIPKKVAGIPQHITISASLGSIKMILITRTVMSIVNYFLLCRPAFEPHFYSIGHYVKKLTPPQTEKLELQPVPKVTININLGTPYLLIPSGGDDFKSKEHILIDFGKISLQTQFPKEKECSKYYITVEKFQIVSLQNSTAVVSRAPSQSLVNPTKEEALVESRLLSDLTISMDVTVPCDTEAHLLPNATINLKSSNLLFTISKSQLVFLLHTAADNLLQPIQLTDEELDFIFETFIPSEESKALVEQSKIIAQQLDVSEVIKTWVATKVKLSVESIQFLILERAVLLSEDTATLFTKPDPPRLVRKTPSSNNVMSDGNSNLTASARSRPTSAQRPAMRSDGADSDGHRSRKMRNSLTLDSYSPLTITLPDDSDETKPDALRHRSSSQRKMRPKSERFERTESRDCETNPERELHHHDNSPIASNSNSTRGSPLPSQRDNHESSHTIEATNGPIRIRTHSKTKSDPNSSIQVHSMSSPLLSDQPVVPTHSGIHKKHIHISYVETHQHVDPLPLKPIILAVEESTSNSARPDSGRGRPDSGRVTTEESLDSARGMERSDSGRGRSHAQDSPALPRKKDKNASDKKHAGRSRSREPKEEGIPSVNVNETEEKSESSRINKLEPASKGDTSSVSSPSLTQSARRVHRSKSKEPKEAKEADISIVGEKKESENKESDKKDTEGENTLKKSSKKLHRSKSNERGHEESEKKESEKQSNMSSDPEPLKKPKKLHSRSKSTERTRDEPAELKESTQKTQTTEQESEKEKERTKMTLPLPLVTEVIDESGSSVTTPTAASSLLKVQVSSKSRLSPRILGERKTSGGSSPAIKNTLDSPISNITDLSPRATPLGGTGTSSKEGLMSGIKNTLGLSTSFKKKKGSTKDMNLGDSSKNDSSSADSASQDKGEMSANEAEKSEKSENVLKFSQKSDLRFRTDISLHDSTKGEVASKEKPVGEKNNKSNSLSNSASESHEENLSAKSSKMKRKTSTVRENVFNTPILILSIVNIRLALKLNNVDDSDVRLKVADVSLLYPQAPGSLAKLITVYSNNTTNANNNAHTLSTPTNSNSLSGSNNAITTTTTSSNNGEALIMSLHTTKKTNDTNVKLRLGNISILPSVYSLQGLVKHSLGFYGETKSIFRQLEVSFYIQQAYLKEYMSKRVENQVSSSLQLDMSLSNPKIIILKTFDEVISTAFVLSVGKGEITLKKNVVNTEQTMDVKVKVTGFTISRDTIDCSHLTTLRSLPVLKPLDVIFDVKEDLKVQNIKINADSLLSINVSAIDLEVLIQIINKWAPFLLTAKSQAENHLADVIAQYTETDIKIKQEQIQTLIDSKKHLNVRISLEGLELCLMDDVSVKNYDRNVLLLSISQKKKKTPVQVSIEVAPNDDLVVKTVCPLRIDSYNWKLSCWEPVIEHSLFDLSIAQTKTLTVKLAVLTPLRVNVSPSFLDAVLYAKQVFLTSITGLLKNLQAMSSSCLNQTKRLECDSVPLALKLKKESSTNKRAPVVIENQLGCPVSFWVRGAKEKNKEKNEKIEKILINPTKDDPFPSHPYLPLSRIYDDKFVFEMTINNQTKLITPDGVSWCTQGSEAFPGLTNNIALLVVIEVIDNAAGKRVILKTNESILNNSLENFHLMFKAGNKIREKSLRPGEWCGVPIEFYGVATGNSTVSFCPRKSNYGYAEWKSDAKKYSVPPQDPLLGSPFCFVAVPKVETLTGKSMKDDGKMNHANWTIVLDGLITMENTLATPFKIEQVIEGAHAKKTHASKGNLIPSITKGNQSSHASLSSSSYVRTIPLDGKLQLSSFIGTPEDLTLRITIPGFHPSEPFKLPVRDSKEAHVKVKNIQNDEIMRLFVYRDQTSQIVGDLCYNIVVACRIWVINLTGLPFFYNRSTVAASTNLDVSLLNVDPITAYKNATLPVYYQSSTITTNTKNILYMDGDKLCFSPDGKNWSDELEVNPEIIPLPIPPVHIISKEHNTRYSFVVADESLGTRLQYWRTKVIRIYPAFFLYNNTSHPIFYKQVCKANPAIKFNTIEVPAMTRLPLHFSLDQKDRFDLCVGHSGNWSAPLSAANGGYFQMVLGHGSDPLNVEIALHDVKTFIIVNESKGIPLYNFENKTNYTATIQGPNVFKSPIIVKPNSTASIFWVSPQEDQKITFTFKNETWVSAENKLNFGKIGHHKTCKTDSIHKKDIIDIQVLGVGFTKNVCCFVTKEMADENALIPQLDLTVIVDSMTLTIIDSSPKEFINLTISNADVKLKEYKTSQDLIFTIDELQVDNQMLYSKNPVILYSGSKKENKFFSLEMIIDTSAKGLKSYPNFDLKVEPIIAFVDITLITYAIAYVNWVLGRLNADQIKERLLKRIQGEPFDLLTYKPKDIENSTVLYFQQFLISAIKISLTLSTSQNSTDLDLNYLTAKDLGVSQLIKAYAKVELNDSTISVKPLTMMHVFATPEQFGDSILEEYKVQLIFQAMRLIGGKVVSAIASGTGSLLYSPINAAKLITGKKNKFNAAKNAQAEVNTGITGMFAKKKQHRKRTPRYFDKTGRLVSWDDIETKSTLLNLEGGAFQNTDILFFSKTSESTSVMITFGSVLFLASGPGRLCPWKLSEEIPHHRIHKETIVMNENTITFQYFNEVNFTWEVTSRAITFSSHSQSQECFDNLRLFALVDSFANMKETSKSTKELSEIKQQIIKQDTVMMSTKASKTFTSEICEVSQGKLKTKKKAFLLSQCYITVDTTKNDIWIIMEIDSKEVSFIKCKNIKEVEEWLSTCVANGAISSYFS